VVSRRLLRRLGFMLGVELVLGPLLSLGVIWLFAQTAEEVVDGGSRWINEAAFSRRPSACKSQSTKQQLELRFHALLTGNTTKQIRAVEDLSSKS